MILKARELGAVDLLLKPFVREQLHQALRHRISTSRALDTFTLFLHTL